MIDIAIDTKERRLLELMHPYGCGVRALREIGKAKPGELAALVERRLCTRDGRNGYDLTEGGRAAIGVDEFGRKAAA